QHLLLLLESRTAQAEEITSGLRYLGLGRQLGCSLLPLWSDVYHDPCIVLYGGLCRSAKVRGVIRILKLRLVSASDVA
ncbi:hypothetical protein RB213_011754, partial [Colletotrichum asianum]